MASGDLTVLSDATHRVDGDVVDGRAWVEPTTLGPTLGWDLKPEGLCRGDLCVPVRDRAELTHGDRIDLVAVAGLLGRPTATDEEAGVVAIGAPSHDRQAMLTDRRAPDFELPDLDGTPRRLHQWSGRRRLLVAFATW